MKIYKVLRGLLKASALTTVMFIMQACYGSPYGSSEMQVMPEEEMSMETDTIQPQVDVEIAVGAEAEAE